MYSIVLYYMGSYSNVRWTNIYCVYKVYSVNIQVNIFSIFFILIDHFDLVLYTDIFTSLSVNLHE